MKDPKFFDLVTPKAPGSKWEIGQIVGMSHFELSIGPVLKVKDVVSGIIVDELPDRLDRLVREEY